MKLNGVQVFERFNRPGVLKRTVLRCNFVSNGQFVDPYDISAVALFSERDYTAPSSVIGSANVIVASALSGTRLKFRWEPSGTLDTTGDTLPVSAYSAGGATTSSIFREDVGKYLVVLDGISDVSSQDINGSGIVNSASAAGKYSDFWTVQMAAASDWQVFTHEVELFQDNVVTINQPLMLTSKTKLVPNKVQLGSKIDLKVFTEVSIQNKDIDQTIKNTFNNSVVDEPKFLIRKHNEDHNLPARVTVKSFADTSGDISTTSDNTMIYRFDTSVLTDGSVTDLGAGTGTYSLEAKFDIMGETMVTPLMYFTVR